MSKVQKAKRSKCQNVKMSKCQLWILFAAIVHHVRLFISTMPCLDKTMPNARPCSGKWRRFVQSVIGLCQCIGQNDAVFRAWSGIWCRFVHKIGTDQSQIGQNDAVFQSMVWHLASFCPSSLLNKAQWGGVIPQHKNYKFPWRDTQPLPVETKSIFLQLP